MAISYLGGYFSFTESWFYGLVKLVNSLAGNFNFSRAVYDEEKMWRGRVL